MGLGIKKKKKSKWFSFLNNHPFILKFKTVYSRTLFIFYFFIFLGAEVLSYLEYPFQPSSTVKPDLAKKLPTIDTHTKKKLIAYRCHKMAAKLSTLKTRLIGH